MIVETNKEAFKKYQNKPHADWTYLLMKVRTSMRTSERTNKQMNNGQTNEKAISVMFLCEKEQQNMWKSPQKICRNGDFQHISGIFGQKNFFSKIRLGYVFIVP